MFKCWFTLVISLLPLCLLSQSPGDMISPSKALPADTAGQKDIIEVFLDVTHIKIKSRRRVKGKKVYYSLLPFGTLPTGGTALVTTTQAGFYLGERRNTYLSKITFSPSTNLHGQFNFPFLSNIWLAGNKWNLDGDLRYSYIPFDTWGMGGRQAQNDKIRLNYSYVRLYASASKRIKPYFFAGLGYNLDYYIRIRPEHDSIDIQEFTGYPYGTANHSNSFSQGVSVNLLYDTRVNSINPLPGYYGRMVFRLNPVFLGNSKPWFSLYTDVRKYIPFNNKGQNMLALWTYVWTSFGSAAPYLALPALGWDPEQKSARGFYNRRYTGNTLWYAEAEYRRDITTNGLFGFVIFTNVNSVTEPGTRRFAYLHPAAGAGLRVKFNKNTATNLGIDFGVSKNNSGIYFTLGETF